MTESRYAPISEKRLPSDKRSISLPGAWEDTGKIWKCWHCGAICKSDREILASGSNERAGVATPSNLALLLHMDGTDASTTFTDSGDYSHTVTAVGNAQISTGQYKFGTASGLFDGTGDYLTIPHHTMFDLSDAGWTIDFYIRGNWSGTGTEGIYFQGTDANNYFSVGITKDSAGYGASLSIYASGSEVVSLSTGTPRLTNATWEHVRFSEYLDNYSVFVNGKLVKRVEDANTPADYTGTVYIGCTAASGSADNYFNGYLDELRVIRAPFLENFDLPTAAYDTNTYITGRYAPEITGGCWFCGSKNYK